MKSNNLRSLLLLFVLVFYISIYPRDLQIGAPTIFMLIGVGITLIYLRLFKTL